MEMRSNIYQLPFEKGLKTGLKIYLKRLLNFFIVVGISLFLFFLVLAVLLGKEYLYDNLSIAVIFSSATALNLGFKILLNLRKIHANKIAINQEILASSNLNSTLDFKSKYLESFIKRLFDIIFSSFMIFFISPVLLAITMYLLISKRGNIFIKGSLLGANGLEFKKYQFRSKGNLNGNDNFLNRLFDNIDNFLYYSGLNELPILFNVLKGEMTVVGTSHVIDVDLIENSKPNIGLKPGLISISDIIFDEEEILLSNSKGNKEEFRKLNIIPFKQNLDSWYGINSSFLTDVKILIIGFVNILNHNSSLAHRVFKNLPSWKFDDRTEVKGDSLLFLTSTGLIPSK